MMLIVQIASRKKTVSSTDTSLNGTISFDSTIGQNTTLVFSYSGTTDIDVNVTSAKGNNITRRASCKISNISTYYLSYSFSVQAPSVSPQEISNCFNFAININLR